MPHSFKKKVMKKITSKEDVDKYFATDALSQSELKYLLKGYPYYLKRKEEPFKATESMLIGSAVDCILTGEEGQFKEEYYILTTPKPTEKVLEIIDAVAEELIFLEETSTVELLDHTTILEGKIEAFKYQSRWKMETRVTKILDEGSEYFKAKVASIGKKVISPEQWNTITQVVTSLRTHVRTAHFFQDECTFEIEFQKPIFFKYEGLDCKALLDFAILVRDAKGEVVEVLPYDLKTTYESTVNFPNIVRNFRYDIQAAWYSLALKEEYPKATIKNFTFVVESTTNPGTPLVLQTTLDFLITGITGREAVMQEDVTLRQRVLGIKDLLAKYKYHTTTDLREEQYITENPILNLSWDKIQEKP